MEWNHEKDKNWKDKQLNARKEMAFMEYLRSLKIDLQQRYPEKTVKQDGKSSCVLDEIAEMLQVSLPNEKIMKDIGIYLEEIKKQCISTGTVFNGWIWRSQGQKKI